MSRLMLAMLSIAMMVTLVVAVPTGAQPLPEGEPLPEQGLNFEELGQEFDFEPFKIKLRGFTVVPAVSTEGSGKFEIDIVGEIDTEELELEEIDELEYFMTLDLPGSTVIGAELRLGRKLTNGGLMVLLCGTPPLDADPVVTEAQVCSVDTDVTGRITADDIVGPEAQGIGPGEFLKALRAFEKGAVYVNVRTAEFPDGELRGQLNDFEFRPIIIGGPSGPFPCGPGGPGGPGEPFPCGDATTFPSGPDGFPCDLSVGPCGPGPNDGFFPDGEHDGDFPCDPNAAGSCEPTVGGDFPCDPTAGFPCEPDPFDSGTEGAPEPFDPDGGGTPPPTG